MRKTFRNKKKSRKTRKRGGSRPEGSDMAPRAVPNQDSESPIDIVKDNDELQGAEQKEEVRATPVSGDDTSENKTKKNISNYLFKTNRISMQSNNDSSYKEIAIIHMSIPGAVNVARDIGSGFMNAIGRKGFDVSRYDAKRLAVLEKLNDILDTSSTCKICNLKIDIESTKGNNFFIHTHASLFDKIN